MAGGFTPPPIPLLFPSARERVEFRDSNMVLLYVFGWRGLGSDPYGPGPGERL